MGKNNPKRGSEKRSLALSRAVIQKLKNKPELWDIPLQNIEQWTYEDGSLPPAYQEWKEILHSSPKEAIVKMLLAQSQRGINLRKNSPFSGIIDQVTRNKIFDKYRRRV